MADSNATRSKRKREKKKALGLIEVRVIVHQDQAWIIRKVAEKINSGKYDDLLKEVIDEFALTRNP